MDTRHALDAIATQGYVVLERIIEPDFVAELTSAIVALERDRPMGRNDFEGKRTHRVYSLAGKGGPFMRLAEHPQILEILDRTLQPNWLLSTFQSIRLHPGETAQAWHTDDAFYLIPRPRHRLAISTIWAIEEFTSENGATCVIPGSHLWGDEHPGDVPHRVVPVEMPAGSVVVFDAALWHHGGDNRSSGTRLAMSPQYCQPWLRPQESQLLVVPPERAAAFTARGRSMLGYSIHPPFIGQVEGMNPIRLVDPEHRSGNRAQLTPEAEVADRYFERP